MYSFFGYIGIKYFRGIPMYLEYMVLCTYIGNARLRAFPMYYYSSFSRRYIGIEISMPIPMYGDPNLSKIYIGMSQYRPSPMYRQILPKQNTSEFQVFIQSRCIAPHLSRNIRTPAVHISYRIPQQDRKEHSLQVHPLFQPLYCERVCHLNRTYCPQG